jgi:type I restriction enzyme R subunit
VDRQPSPNFAFLAHHDARLVALGTQAEAHFAGDAAICLFKLRQFGELLAQRAAAKLGLFTSPTEPQADLVNRIWDKGAIGATQRTLFHDLRKVGNAAVHEGKGDHREALHQLKMARELAVWFQRTFGNDRRFDPGPFVPPAEPQKAEAVLHEELARLRADVAARATEVEAARRAIDEAKKAADAELAERLTAEQRAAKAKDDLAIWETLANEELESHRESAKAAAAKSAALDAQNKKLLAELAALQAAAKAMPVKQLDLVVARAASASDDIKLDEAATRKLIDHQLRDAGWEADSEALTFERGVRPTKGKNVAIAEWPTLAGGKEGWADYVLFAGLQVVAVVEAKRKHKDIPGVIAQAKRYSAGYLIKGDEFLPEGGPWGVHRVPFLFATNGRPFLRQLRTKSGIWFLDARRAANNAEPLEGWYTPAGLLERLKLDVDLAHAKLEVEPMAYIERGYQRSAILAVEKAIAEGKREILVAMATGTGKTRTCIGLCYRLVKTRRFRRVLFLVDRNALGQQTADAFKDLRLDNLQAFTDIFDVKELSDQQPDPDTRWSAACSAPASPAARAAARPRGAFRRSTSTTASSSTSATAGTSSTARCRIASSAFATRTTTSPSTAASSITSTR